MSRYRLSPRSAAVARCEGRVKAQDGPEKGRAVDRCKFNALPGRRFCKRHQGARDA